MIFWTCIADGSELAASADDLACPTCNARYRCVDGISVFASGAGVESAISAAIRDQAAGGSIDDAASEVCKRRGLLRNRFTTDWDFFLPVGRTSRVLHIGAGFGDRTLAVSRVAKSVIALVPGEANALTLQAHAREKNAGNVHIAVLEELGRLPLAAGSVDVVAMDLPGAAAFGTGNADIAAIVAEFRRVLVPGGALLLGCGNRLFRFPGLNRLRPGSSLPTLDDALAAENPRRRPALALRPALRALARGGYGPPTLLAPLPRREEISVVIPVREKAVLQYFFDRLFRKNSPVVRAGLALARVATTLDVIWWVVPDYFVVARLPAGQPAVARGLPSVALAEEGA